MINNRQQNSRRRGRGGQRPQGNGGSGGGRNQDNGNRIDNRSRGNAAQMLEKYKTLARDSQQAGDRVLTEYYLQFADHYFRVLADSRARFEESQPRREGRDDDQQPQGYEGDEGFESDDLDEFYPRTQPQQTARPQPQQRYDRSERDADGGEDQRPRRDYNERRPNGRDTQRDDRPREQSAREDRPRDDRPRDDRPREDRPREDRPRDDRPRDERPRDDRPAVEGRTERPRLNRRPDRDAPDAAEAPTLGFTLPPAIGVVAEPVVESGAEAAEAPAPKRRGRPKKTEVEAAAE